VLLVCLCLSPPACSLDESMAERDDGTTANVDGEPDGDVGPDADADSSAEAEAEVDADGDADADADAGGLVLNAAGMATVAGEGLAAGTMRLMEVAFEGGGRSCAGSLCLWVEVMP